MKESTFNKFLLDALDFIELARCLGYDYKILKGELLGVRWFVENSGWFVENSELLIHKHPKDQAVEDIYNRLVDTYITEFDIQAKNELDGQQSLFNEKGDEE